MHSVGPRSFWRLIGCAAAELSNIQCRKRTFFCTSSLFLAIRPCIARDGPRSSAIARLCFTPVCTSVAISVCNHRRSKLLNLKGMNEAVSGKPLAVSAVARLCFMAACTRAKISVCSATNGNNCQLDRQQMPATATSVHKHPQKLQHDDVMVRLPGGVTMVVSVRTLPPIGDLLEEIQVDSICGVLFAIPARHCSPWRRLWGRCPPAPRV